MIQVAKSTFPSTLRHISDDRFSFSLKWSDNKKIPIMPSVWGLVMSKYGTKKPFENTYHTVFVHIQPDAGLVRATPVYW
jgi:hypothetical protein